MGNRIIALGFLAFSVVCSATASGDGCIMFSIVDENLSGRKPAQSAQQAALF